MHPTDIALIRAMLDRIRLIGEDFARVYCNRLMAQAPELRLHYLPTLADGGYFFRALDMVYAKLDDPEALCREMNDYSHLSHEAAQRLRALHFDALLWSAERCLGAELSDEHRQAFGQLQQACMEIRERQKARTQPARKRPAAEAVRPGL